jgi:outer membrane biosynthesis protein TonB
MAILEKVKGFLVRLKDWAVATWPKLYANKLFYRLFWTGISVAAGWAAVEYGADPKWGATIVLVTTAITSVARENLNTPEKREAVKEKLTPGKKAAPEPEPEPVKPKPKPKPKPKKKKKN